MFGVNAFTRLISALGDLRARSDNLLAWFDKAQANGIDSTDKMSDLDIANDANRACAEHLEAKVTDGKFDEIDFAPVIEPFIMRARWLGAEANTMEAELSSLRGPQVGTGKLKRFLEEKAEVVARAMEGPLRSSIGSGSPVDPDEMNRVLVYQLEAVIAAVRDQIAKAAADRAREIARQTQQIAQRPTEEETPNPKQSTPAPSGDRLRFATGTPWEFELPPLGRQTILTSDSGERLVILTETKFEEIIADVETQIRTDQIKQELERSGNQFP